MKLPKNKMAVLGLVLAAAVLVSAAVLVKSSQQRETASTPQESSTNPDGTDKDNQSDPAAQTEAPGPQPGNPPPPPAAAAQIKPLITTLTADSSFVRIRAMVEKVLTGTCTATFNKGSAKVERSAVTQVQAEQSVCQGFDIPRGEFSSGAWSVTVKVTADGYDATSESKTIDLE